MNVYICARACVYVCVCVCMCVCLCVRALPRVRVFIHTCVRARVFCVPQRALERARVLTPV